MTTEHRKMIAASMGDCVHVAGIINFLRLAQLHGWETKFLGAAKSPREIAALAKETRAHTVAVGFRLGPDAAGNLIARLKQAMEEEHISPDLILGGTPTVAKVAVESGIFKAVFSGKESIDEIIAFLQGGTVETKETNYPDNLVERIKWKSPYPILRHHFGMSTVDSTVEGIKQIAQSGVIDVVSIGPDQNAQEHFFHPEKMDKGQDGAGGVPIRSREDFVKLYEATRCGNYPIMRCYSGTNDVLDFAGLLRETINNAWVAVPLCWYNVLDYRSDRTILRSMKEGKESMEWHARRGIPVEVNESHHWSLRDAPDSVAVAAAFLAAYNGKKAKVKDYVSQYMFNTPANTWATADLGKMLAKNQMIESLSDSGFRVWRQVRAGLASFPTDLDLAKGQLATSTLVSMNLRPHILHVVGFCEAVHVATATDVIESSKIAWGVIKNCVDGMPDMTLDPRVRERRDTLMEDAGILLKGIESLGQIMGIEEDSWSCPEVLEKAIKVGLLDAPHLAGNAHACGLVQTMMIDGACVAVDPITGRIIPEKQRVEKILAKLD